MKNRNLVLIIGILAIVLIVVAGYLLLNNQRQSKEAQQQVNVPAGIEKYYQEATPSPQTGAEVKSVSDLDSLSKEIDSSSVDVDSDLKKLDSDFASF